MNTRRSKRWNGNLDTLSPDYLKDVIEKMESYGDRVQFELPCKGPRPPYQVISASERKIAFDSKNLLASLNADGNVSENLSAVFSLEAIKRALTGGGPKSTSPRARVSRPAGTTTRSAPAAAAVVDTVEKEKYEYFKANRENLPDGIQKFSQNISDMMRKGMSAENAFEEIIKQHLSE